MVEDIQNDFFLYINREIFINNSDSDETILRFFENYQEYFGEIDCIITGVKRLNYTSNDTVCELQYVVNGIPYSNIIFSAIGDIFSEQRIRKNNLTKIINEKIN